MWCREVLADHAPEVWLPPALGPDHNFRNRAKLAIGGATGALTLGILDSDFDGVDLRECGIQAPDIRQAIPIIADFLNTTGLAPYDVKARRGELKFAHITAAPSGELMVRFVVRSQFGLEVLTSRKKSLLGALPQISVLSINLLPQHQAVLEGENEILLHGDSLRMNLGEVELHLRPQSFFQTNTAVAIKLYLQVAEWVDAVSPRRVWDLYCGVGGFALYCAQSSGGQRRVTGVEISEQAIKSARISATELGVAAQFSVGDATEFAETNFDEGQRPDCVIVNPPRRGIGKRLATALENSGADHIVYSSCNPLSLATDLAQLPSYTVSQARIFDMFPHTKHLEVALLLSRQ